MLAFSLLSTIAAVVPANGVFTCQVVAVHDGDGPIRCANGIKVRVAGVQAPDYESAEPCRVHRARYVCSDAQADRSRTIVMRLVQHQTLACVAVGKSYARVVARCQFANGLDLSCAILASGAATRWDSYWRRYRMGACPRVTSPSSRLRSASSRYPGN
jgi:endonuclease YncB( thermonuclease family)